MSNTNSSNSAAVPEAKSALNRFKYEVANELGVPYIPVFQSADWNQCSVF